MSVVKTEEQEEAARRMHEIARFMMPEVAKMCDKAAFDDVRFTCVLLFASAKDNNMVANSVIFDDRVKTESVIQIVKLAQMNLTGEGSGVEHFIRNTGSGQEGGGGHG